MLPNVFRKTEYNRRLCYKDSSIREFSCDR